MATVDDAFYMIRNFMTGDEEEIRIEEEQYWEGLPEWLQKVGLELAEHEYYNAAILIYVQYILTDGGKKGIWKLWEEELEPLARRWSKEWNSLDGGFSDMSSYSPEEVEKMVEDMYQDLKTGWEQMLSFFH